MTDIQVSCEVERIARHWIENGRTDSFGNPDPGDWEHIKRNKPFAYWSAIRIASWVMSLPPSARLREQP